MSSIPLHPLVVHFPIVLAVLLPISAVIALWAIRKGTRPHRAWAAPLALAGLLAVSAFVARQSGETEEDRVERIVGESPLHAHEEAGELFFTMSAVVLLVAAAGLAPRTIGTAARVVATVGAVALLAAGVQVGHSGGKLVYQYGAGAAYTDSAAVQQAGHEEGDDRD